MNRPFYKIVVPLLLFVLSIAGCVSLEQVNKFSSSSLKNIQKFEEIKGGFFQNCTNNCRFKAISDLNIDSPDCDCLADQKADQVTSVIYHALEGYLDGLNRLSKNQLTDYKLGDLSKSLKAIDYSPIKLEKDQVDAYSTISGILLKAFTDKYRKDKIKEFVNAGHQPLKELIGFLNFILSKNLYGKLNVQKQLLKESCFDLTKDTTLSTWEKRKAVEEYYLKIDEIERQQHELLTYSKTLEKITGDHQELVDSFDKTESK